VTVGSDKLFSAKKKKKSFGYNERAGYESLINILANLKYLIYNLLLDSFFVKNNNCTTFRTARNVAKDNNFF
jgi:hypothetical protein